VRLNADPNSGGRTYTDAYYGEELHADPAKHRGLGAIGARALTSIALSNKALTLAGEGDWKRAEELCDLALRLDPENRHAMTAKASALLAEPDPRREAALRELAGWDRFGDAAVPELYFPAMLWRRAGDPERALTLVEQALRAEPKDAQFHVERVKCLAALGRMDEADEAARDLIESDPDDLAPRVLFALVLRARGDASWTTALQGEGSARRDRLATGVMTVRALLDDGADAAAAEDALTILEPLLENDTVYTLTVRSPFGGWRIDSRDDPLRLQARALERLGRTEEAAAVRAKRKTQ
jgi:tetratricopeptide (TPR) repeat protein